MRSLAWMLASIACAPALAAQSVLVVDKNQGPGWEFATIQSAVNAAQDGDILLVRSETYYDESLTIVAKGLTITSDFGGYVRLTEGVTVEGLLPGQMVVLRGLNIEPDTWPANDDKYGLRALNCAGSIRVEGCTLIASKLSGKLGGRGFDGLFADGCTSLVVVDCTLRGGLPPIYSSDRSGGHGLHATDSRISAFGSSFTGVTGYSVDLDGDGVHLEGGWFYAADCTFQGGGSPVTCNGGHGIEAESADLVLLSPTYAPSPCRPPISLTGCTLLELLGPQQFLLMASPVREGQTLLMQAAGEPNQPVLLLVSLGVEDAFAAWLQAPLLVSLSPALIAPVGSTSSIGWLVQSFTVGALPPGIEGATVFCQAAFGAGASVQLSNPMSIVLLDASL